MGARQRPVPDRAYRAALRAVLSVGTDAELGFRPTRCPAAFGPTEDGDDPVGRCRSWTRAAVLDDAVHTTESELMNRRDALRMAAAGGAALFGPLTPWSEPLADGAVANRRGAFSAVEVDALERLVTAFRGWRDGGVGLGRTAVVGQLADVCERLRSAPAGPLTDRVFLGGAELAKIAGSMAFDAGEHRSAQRHFGTAARLAKAGGAASFGAVALAALARQSFDLGAADDGLQIVQLAQRGTRTSATPWLRAMLATREAWAYAQLGEVGRFRQCVDAAQDAHRESEAGREPRWLGGFDAAELNGTIGARYRDLARHDRRQVKGAVVHLSRALELRGATRLRNRAFDLVSLGRAHLLAGAPDEAAASVQAALPHLDRRRPGRLGRKVLDWYAESSPVAAVPSVATARAAVLHVVGAGTVDVERMR